MFSGSRAAAESLVLAALAGVVALLFIQYAAPFVREFFVAELSGREVVDHRVLAVTAAFAMATGLLSGLGGPAIQPVGRRWGPHGRRAARVPSRR